MATVNHSGDSDSTGSITGAILGTLFGVELISRLWVRDVEESGRIKKIAYDMFSIFKNGKRLSFLEEILFKSHFKNRKRYLVLQKRLYLK